MKSIKMFIISASMAILAMALLGASSAMAGSTTLCTGDGTGCEVEHVHETSVGKAVLLSSETVECDALFLGDTVEPVGTPLQILGAFTYSNCNGNCTAKEENGPTEIQVLRTGSELGSVVSGEGTWAGLVNLVCTIFKISCKYVGEGLEGHALGPLTSSQLNGSVTLSNQTTLEEGEKSLCPNEGKLDITTTPLEKTYIGSEGGGGGGGIKVFITPDPAIFTTAPQTKKLFIEAENGSFVLFNETFSDEPSSHFSSAGNCLGETIGFCTEEVTLNKYQKGLKVTFTVWSKTKAMKTSTLEVK